ncbi:hypothetical protein COX24_01245 [bacterium (Candidatus Gribaldobacteria) CG23_combo_of_CG06-09_8_20_14_all_37_87_8]|uniref:Rod shape-determining protein RodA n=1 Tax=bacterium (Candidatus Gribaldobacteria) CG23_combo_of_CG06-09_8_20_14_all_37_87_8 TaxID=2014278 RepID=A0A2G9ZFC9_9BACT|nr:MAG: hypothetical protein COX24_01245 [bacterium (Candidatus Gribaldobacteria) CG23_combo_of_CG06-09_8_20_14_all_37_87_8]
MIQNIKQKFSFGLIIPAILLTLVGLLSIYSSSISRGDFSLFKKQIIWIIFSLVIFFLVSLLDLRFLKNNSKIILAAYSVSLMTLLGLLIVAPVVRGIKGWYQIGPFALDPEPLAAIILILLLSKFFSKRHEELSLFRTIIFSALYALVPVFLIVLQPDLGSALSFIAVWLGIVIFSGVRLKHLLFLGLIFILVAGFSWQFLLEDYHKQRIVSFVNPQIDTQGISWSQNQSKIAVGSGGLIGKGFGKGSQTQRGFLSEPKSDFIFSAIAEEFGFLGSIFILGLLFCLLYLITQSAFLAQNNFLRLYSAGFAFLILAQSFINIGMCLGLFPVVGIPLPFVSYGGSYLLAFYLGLGILTSLKRT